MSVGKREPVNPIDTESSVTALYGDFEFTDRELAESIFDAAHTIAVILDSEGRIIHYNRFLVELSGYSLKEVKGKKWTDVFLPSNKREEEKSELVKLFTDDLLETRRSPIITKDGRIKHVDWHYRKLKDSKGLLKAVLAIGLDTTDRLKVEENLRKSEDNFRKLVETMTNGLCVQTKDFIIYYTNNAFSEMLGYDPDKLLGMVYTELLDFNSKKVFISKFEQSKRGMHTPYELYFKHKAGRLVCARVSPSSITDDRGEVIGSFHVVTDITEQKEAENALRDSERRARLLFNSGNDAIFVCKMDSKGALRNFTEVNDLACDRLGYSRDEFFTMSPYDIDDPEAKTDIARVISDLIRDKTSLFETVHVTKDKRKIPVEISAHLILLDGQRYIMSIARDISQRKQTEQSLISYRDQLRAFASELTLTEERERRRIATDLHDGVGQLLAFAKFKLDKLAKTSLETDIESDILELRDIIESAIKGTRTLTFEISPPILYKFGLSAAIEWVLEQTQVKYGIHCTFTDTSGEYKLDENVQILTFQSIRELIFNVIKHAKAAHINVTIIRNLNSIQISVIDDGIGFEFDKSKGDERSSGFGLFSIRERLDSIGGRLDIDSSPGKGTKTSITVQESTTS